MSNLWLVGVAALVVALVLASVLVAVARGGREIQDYPENTPDGVVQRYLKAVWEEEYQTAYGYLDDELKTYCSYQHFRDSSQWVRDQDMRVSLVGSDQVNGKVEVQVRVSQVHMGGSFTPNESSYTQRFILGPQGDASAGIWRFAEPPWPMNYCPDWDMKNSPRKPIPAAPA
ncbi:MAG: hypothetical protein HW397_471 [Dehalococcoidia bacterium]|nr:hypothetical protein [Dehalococcoidia bacterium]